MSLHQSPFHAAELRLPPPTEAFALSCTGFPQGGQGVPERGKPLVRCMKRGASPASGEPKGSRRGTRVRGGGDRGVSAIVAVACPHNTPIAPEHDRRLPNEAAHVSAIFCTSRTFRRRGAGSIARYWRDAYRTEAFLRQTPRGRGGGVSGAESLSTSAVSKRWSRQVEDKR